MSLQEIAAVSAGCIARGLLEEPQEASVIGSTSRGVFLHLGSGWVIFLSAEVWNGPLTLRVPRAALSVIHRGATAQIATQSIQFPHLLIHTSSAGCWEAPPRPAIGLTTPERHLHFEQTSRLLLLDRQASPLSALLPVLLGQVPTPSDTLLWQQLQAVQRTAKLGETAALTASLAALLGVGPGLTPSGDDLVSGLLLAAARWGNILAYRIDLSTLAQALLPLAWKRSTSLSASLLACAAQGQADERLQQALDSLVTGQPGPAECAARLAAYGSSSGVDALVGMALALI